jgi:dienelactone hydrolase
MWLLRGAAEARVDQGRGGGVDRGAVRASRARPGRIVAVRAALQGSGAPLCIEWVPGAEHAFVFPSHCGVHRHDAAVRHWERLFDLFARRLGRAGAQT